MKIYSQKGNIAKRASLVISERK